MTLVFTILAVQVLLGAFDNFWHHELGARLPRQAPARRELALHAAREAIYALVFIGLARFEWHGALAWLLGALLLAEIAITLADFLEEDRTRRLPPFERVLHTVLAIGYGAFLAALAPHLLAWARRPTAFAPVDHGLFAWALGLSGVCVGLWSVRNALAVRRLGAAVYTKPVPPLATGPAILITGATGFVGSALVASLRADGRRLIVLSRDARQARLRFGGGAGGGVSGGVAVVESLDEIAPETRIAAVVNLAGARVLGLPWTAARRRTLLESRVGVTAAVVALMRRLEQPPRVLVSASAVGFYGAADRDGHGDAGRALDETAGPRRGEFQSDLCAAIEHEAGRAAALGVRVVKLRLGIVLGGDDGAYPMLALSARLGLGARLGDGRQPVPWLHIDDAVGIIRFALANAHLRGAVNAVAPAAPDQRRFADALAASFGRRVRLAVPALPLRALLGEMSELLLAGQNAVPRAAVDAGYVFRFDRLEEALAALAAPAGSTPGLQSASASTSSAPATGTPQAKLNATAQASSSDMPGFSTDRPGCFGSK